MVLAELGGRICRALQQLNKSVVVNEKVLTECLNEIARALLQADVQFQFVRNMMDNIKRIVNLEELAAGHNKRRIIEKAVSSELCRMLDPGKPAFTPEQGKTSVVMFVGLQGSGKTTTCTKYANYYKKKGFKPALICADTFRAGAFDQLKQNSTKVGIPFYGSYIESDPVKIAAQGVERFRREDYDLIVVDTSGRHKQEAALLEEMRQVSEAVKPDLIVYVMDSSIGQTAYAQAQAFKQSVPVGAVIITKMDGHSKGGGALSAVASTRSPVIFIGTGEHFHQLDIFDAKSFVNRLLGKGDLSGFVDKIQEVIPSSDQLELELQHMENLSKGIFTLRLMKKQYQKALHLGPLGQIFSMIPGFNVDLMPAGLEEDRRAQIKRYMIMMDSMTDKELDSTNPMKMSESQLIRIARGSGKYITDVTKMLEEYTQFTNNMKKCMHLNNMNNKKKGLRNAQNRSFPQQFGKMGDFTQQLMSQISFKA